MQIQIRNDKVIIEGYVNAVERNSKTLRDRFGEFIERICKGAFKKAINRNDNIRILLNHNPQRDLGGTADGNLELYEDNIGLHAKAEITDREVIEDARKGNLVGWSFGFTDTPNGVERVTENGIPTRIVKDMNLEEVSLLNRQRTPAYDGTLVCVRAEDNSIQLRGEEFIDEVNTTDESVEEVPNQQEVDEHRSIDYGKYEKLIQEMKEDKYEEAN